MASKKLNGWRQRMNWTAFKRLPIKARAGVIAILVIGLSVMAMLIGGREPAPAARNDSRSAAQPAMRSAAAIPVASEPMGTTGAAAEERPNSSPKPAPVTITGCLEQNDATFRLKDTSGLNAPKSRSWKTGFLKKSSASIEVVDASHRLKLTDHVGKRVSVTGILVDREMQIRSLQNVASSCNAKDAKVKI